MSTTRTTSILDAAEAALARCGAKASPAGISPERVRLLMREQAIKFAHVKMPSTPAPERALKASRRKKAASHEYVRSDHYAILREAIKQLHEVASEAVECGPF